MLVISTVTTLIGVMIITARTVIAVMALQKGGPGARKLRGATI